ncbi:MAG: response regulator [Candidatus Omnitrophota bacterium]
MKKVLIVDDELEFVNDFARGLEMFGYKVYKAGDGEDALNMLQKNKPDIVLCDYRLPDIDGDKILEKAKAAEPKVKFVMITAYYDEAVEKRLRGLGADEVVYKPIVLTEIEGLLAKL